VHAYFDMPRLPTHRYLTIYHVLRTWWLVVYKLDSELNAREHWYLHDYFRRAEALDKLSLLAHRRWIGKERPALP
jgi:hypothetical protein